MRADDEQAWVMTARSFRSFRFAFSMISKAWDGASVNAVRTCSALLCLVMGDSHGAVLRNIGGRADANPTSKITAEVPHACVRSLGGTRGEKFFVGEHLKLSGRRSEPFLLHY